MSRCLVFLGLLSLSVTLPRLGHCVLGVADIVNDPLNLVQNSLTSARSLISNANEVTQIQNQITSLANEARQLVSLPLNLVNEINGAIGQYTALLNEGRGIAYQYEAAVGQFEALYAQGFGGNGSFMQRAQGMMNQMREAGRLATTATAVFDRLCAQQTRVGQLVAASQAAVGQMQVEQASNQLLGEMAAQNISIQQILATDQRLKISEGMRQLVLEEKAYDNAQAYGAGLAVVPVRGPGEGQGFTLPD